MFFNMAAWKAPAPHIQLIVTQNFTERATAERNDLLKLTRREQQNQTKRGTIFNKPDGEPFGEALHKTGFYPEAKKYNARSYLLAAGAVRRAPCHEQRNATSVLQQPGACSQAAPVARQPHRSTRNTALPLIRRARSSSAT
jgi:hypothetical protein